MLGNSCVAPQNTMPPEHVGTFCSTRVYCRHTRLMIAIALILIIIHVMPRRLMIRRYGVMMKMLSAPREAFSAASLFAIRYYARYVTVDRSALNNITRLMLR